MRLPIFSYTGGTYFGDRQMETDKERKRNVERTRNKKRRKIGSKKDRCFYRDWERVCESAGVLRVRGIVCACEKKSVCERVSKEWVRQW